MAPDPNVLAQWYHYEEIAMPFNTLIMQFRLQLLGGAGLIGTVASYLIGGKIEDEINRHWLRFVVSSGLLVLITAAAILDVFYYDQLLRGAVDELLNFETLHPDIRMSTTIENVVGWGRYAADFSYGLILFTLGAFTVWAYRVYRRDRRRSTREAAGDSKAVNGPVNAAG
jgi:hypothetical protein